MGPNEWCLEEKHGLNPPTPCVGVFKVHILGAEYQTTILFCCDYRTVLKVFPHCFLKDSGLKRENIVSTAVVKLLAKHSHPHENIIF